MSSETEEEVIDLVLVRNVRKIKIGGDDYTVQEMDGIELGKWRAAMADRAKFSSTGVVVGLKTYTGVEAELISKCLLNSRGEPVPKDTIIGWPVTAQLKLVEICEKLNGLEKDSAENEKKS